MKKMHLLFYVSVGVVLSLVVMAGFFGAGAFIPEQEAGNLKSNINLLSVFGYGLGAVVVVFFIIFLVGYIENSEELKEKDSE